MRLSEIRGHQQDRQPAQPLQHNDQLGTIRNATAFPKPIDALYQGQPVRLIGTGDIVGMSPAVQIVDEQGKLDWVSFDDVTVTQRRFLPASNRSELRQRLSTQQPQQNKQYARQ